MNLKINKSPTAWTIEEMSMLYNLRQSGKTHASIADIMSTSIGKRTYNENSIHKKWQQTDWESFLQRKSALEQQTSESDSLESEKSKIIEHTLGNNERLLRRERARTDIIIDSIKSAIYRLPAPNSSEINYTNKSKVTKYTSEEVGVVISDMHIGASYTFEETGGLSEYNYEIYKQRMETLRSSVIKIVDRHKQMYSLPILHVFSLGDVVAGMHDAGQWSSNYIDMDIYDQMMAGAYSLRDVLATWSKHFEKVIFYGVYGNHGRCLPVTTRVLTPDGYKSHEALKVGDLVGSMNTKTNKFEFQPIQEMTYIENEESIFRYKSSNFILDATYDHDILLWNRHKKCYQKRAFKDIAKIKDSFALPISCSVDIDEEFDIDDHEIALLGLIMSDGSCQDGRIQIYQSKPHTVSLIKEFLLNYGIEFSEYIRDKNVEEICGKKVKECHVEHCFNLLSSETKNKIKNLLPQRESVPNWMYKMSTRQVSILLHWIGIGDGSFRQDRINSDGYTRSGGLDVIWGRMEFLEQILGLLVSHDIPADIERHKCTDCNENYYLQIRKTRHYTVKADKIESLLYNQPVWCVAVDNGTLFVLNEHGDAFITGNCGKRGQEKTSTNWDRICYEIIKLSLGEYKNIEWNVPKAWFIDTEIMGHRFYLTHGDGIKGQMGIPFYGVERAQCKIGNMMDKSPKYILMGHFHTPAELQTTGSRVIMNGSFMGGDMYSIQDLQRCDAAEQKMFGIHPKHGITWKYDIQLDHKE